MYFIELYRLLEKNNAQTRNRRKYTRARVQFTTSKKHKMWVARDKSGTLALFTKRPVRSTSVGVWTLRGGEFIFLDEDDPNFTNLTWDDEPVEVWLKEKK